jgi:hypothetical protein
MSAFQQQLKPLSWWISYWATFDSSRGVTRAFAHKLSELGTHGQLAAIRSVSNSQRLDAGAECVRLFKCKPEELCRDAASAFISYLKLSQAEREKAA